MSHMFDGCNSLKNLDLSNFDTQKVTYMGNIFWGCNSLKTNNIITNDDKILNNLYNDNENSGCFII